MPTVAANGIELYYETVGDSSDPPLLLVCGLGMQLTSWTREWFERLASEGLFVIAFDNRDTGLSTHLRDLGTPNLEALFSGGDLNVRYQLSDVAADAAGLLDALGIESAHVVGISMGGMIAQQLVIDRPERVRSLCSIMSTTGAPDVGQPTPDAIAALLRPAPASRAEAVEAAVASFAVFGSPDFPIDEDAERERAGEAYDRSNDPEGVARQLGAILVSPDRTAALGAVAVPTVVIHGDRDALVTPSGGEATARAVPGAHHVVVTGMGHHMPEQTWDVIVPEIVRNVTRTAEGAAATAPVPAAARS